MNNKNKRKTIFSVLILILAAMIWGLAFSAQKGAGELGGFTVGAVRNLFATLFLIPMIPMTDKLTGSGRHILIKCRKSDAKAHAESGDDSNLCATEDNENIINATDSEDLRASAINSNGLCASVTDKDKNLTAKTDSDDLYTSVTNGDDFYASAINSNVLHTSVTDGEDFRSYTTEAGGRHTEAQKSSLSDKPGAQKSSLSDKLRVQEASGSDKYEVQKSSLSDNLKVQKASRSDRFKARPDISKSEIIGGIIAGFFMTFATALQQNGIGDGTDAGKAGFITALYVVIVPIYALLFGKKSPVRVWISALIAIVGFYFLSVSDTFSIVPSDLLILLCALVFAGQIMAVDIFSERCECVRLSLVQFASGFVINLIFALIFESPIAFSGILSCILPLLYLGIFSSGIAYTLQVIGQKDLNPGVASILLSLESVFGAIGGALIYGETMSKRELIGAAAVFLAVVLSQIDFSFIFKNHEKHKEM